MADHAFEKWALGADPGQDAHTHQYAQADAVLSQLPAEKR